MSKQNVIYRLMLLLCVNIMLFAAASGTAFAISHDKELSPDGSVTDTISGLLKDESRTYMVELPQSGRLTIYIDSKSSDMSLEVLDSEESLLGVKLIKEGGTRLNYDLTAGTYYLKFKNKIGRFYICIDFLYINFSSRFVF